MIRVLMVAALAFASTVAIAAPKENTACAPVAKFEKAAADIAKRTGTALVHLTGGDAQKVVTAWNAVPPVSNQAAQDVLIIASPSAPGALIAFVDSGRVCGFSPMPTRAMVAFLRRAFSAPEKKATKDDDGHVKPWNNAI